MQTWRREYCGRGHQRELEIGRKSRELNERRKENLGIFLLKFQNVKPYNIKICWPTLVTTRLTYKKLTNNFSKLPNHLPSWIITRCSCRELTELYDSSLTLVLLAYHIDHVLFNFHLPILTDNTEEVYYCYEHNSKQSLFRANAADHVPLREKKCLLVCTYMEGKI